MGSDLVDNQCMLEFVLGYSAGANTASRSASLARSAAVADGTHHTNRIEDLNERIDRMAMILRAMWALMEEQGLTADQLIEKLEAIDMSDGQLDGQVRQSIVECSSCQSKVAPGLTNCQFCGAAVARGDEHPLGDV